MVSDLSLKVVGDYAQKLSKLTFNSRPIITELTEMAGENIDVADEIVSVITNRIYKCIPEQKLFVLYLLDSICKNVGSPYNIVFGDDIFKLFSYVYLLVGDAVRQKMVNLFETWKLTKAKGMNIPLFPDEQMEKIENLLLQASLKGLTNRSLIEDINKIIPVFEMKLKKAPDQRLKEKLNALVQLRTLLSGQPMKPNDLLAVKDKLNEFKQLELGSNNKQSHRPVTPVSTAPSTATNTPKLPPTPLSVPRAKDLFHALLASGLVTVDQSLIPGSKPKYELVYPRIKYQPPSNELPSSNVLQDILSTSASNNIKRTEYERLKFNELSKIENDVSKSFQSFINNNKPSQLLVSLVYNSKPSKCGLCGKRFTNDENGATKNKLHLDWHFRINKKLTAGNSNVHSRNWYLDDIDWVKFKDEDLLEYSTTSLISNPVVSSANLPTNNEISYVIVPSSETNMNNKCIICREQIKATYNDDLGEWCWMNCVKAPGEGKNSRKIVHITCFDEANRKRGPDEDLKYNFKREKL